MSQKKLLVILGPTATGKTELGINLARKFNGEIIACDSRQVYQGLDIGTGKEPGKKLKVKSKKYKKFWQINGVKIWMYDVADLRKQYTVYDHHNLTKKIIDQIFDREKLPIIVGGSGLYLKALLEGFSNFSIPKDNKLRNELTGLELVDLQKKLQLLSPAVFFKLNNSDKNNKRRLVRAVELVVNEPKDFQISNFKSPFTNVLKIGLTAPRKTLYQKINRRVLGWIDQGIIDEVKGLMGKTVTEKRFKELGLGYGAVADYLAGKIKDRQELINLMQIRTRQYAKRQMTWFKKEKDIRQFDITYLGWQTQLEKMVLNWYNAKANGDTQS